MDELLWISHATGQMEREIGRSKVHLECSVYSILVREMRYVVSVPPKKNTPGRWLSETSPGCRIIMYYRETSNTCWTCLEISAFLSSPDECGHLWMGVDVKGDVLCLWMLSVTAPAASGMLRLLRALN